MKEEGGQMKETQGQRRWGLIGLAKTCVWRARSRSSEGFNKQDREKIIRLDFLRFLGCHVRMDSQEKNRSHSLLLKLPDSPVVTVLSVGFA